jgi:hypothetical protein
MYKFDKINKESLTKLYSEYGFRLKEIGSMVGISEDAVFKRIKQYGISTNPRGKELLDVEVLFTGKKKDKRKALSGEELLRLCKIGYSDAAIGKMFNMTGEGIAYRRKKFNIPLSIKANETKDNIEKLKETSKTVLEKDYYDLNQEEFSKKYKISKIVWRPYLKSAGIIGKEVHRIEKYPPFNSEQRSLIIGGLLGDGSVSEGTRYYESHSNKQKLYLFKKNKILEPFSSKISPCDNNTGLRLSTIHHPNFLEFHKVFYEERSKGKLIPVDFIKDNWHDYILAYWFFDDGYYNDETNEFSIYNKSPYPEQLLKLVQFLESHYGWRFHYSTSTFQLTFSKEFYKDFVDILLQVATSDLYYKIPEAFLTDEMAQSVMIYAPPKNLYPKFYRKLKGSTEKRVMEGLLYRQLRNRSFPYVHFTLERRIYLLNLFKKNEGFKIKGDKLICGTHGMNLCEYYFPNIYECRKKNFRSPVELWVEDGFIQRLVKNRLNYADRLTDSSLRTGIKILSKAVSNFKPVIAKFLYQKYVTNGKVFDYSCGFGSRMLAALSLDMEYVGCEPNLKTLENLKKFGEFLKDRTKGSFIVTKEGSEEYIYKNEYFSFAFSSPPFFDYEIYSQDPGQSIIKYPFYEDWLIKFWRKTIENCYTALIPGGCFGICISMNQHEDLIKKTKEYCHVLGLSFVTEYKALYKQLFHSNEKYDLIMIYKK